MVINFKSTLSDPCIFIRGKDVIIVYVDDCCIIRESEQRTIEIYKEIMRIGFRMTDEGSMKSYLGLRIDQTKAGEFTISQLFLVGRIIDSTLEMHSARISTIPTATDVTLTKDKVNAGRMNGTIVL